MQKFIHSYLDFIGYELKRNYIVTFKDATNLSDFRINNKTNSIEILSTEPTLEDKYMRDMLEYVGFYDNIENSIILLRGEEPKKEIKLKKVIRTDYTNDNSGKIISGSVVEEIALALERKQSYRKLSEGQKATIKYLFSQDYNYEAYQYGFILLTGIKYDFSEFQDEFHVDYIYDHSQIIKSFNKELVTELTHNKNIIKNIVEL